MINQPFDHKLIIQKLYLQNFRLFKEFEIDFDPKLTIIIAENGAGKSSILDAISGHLHYLTDYIQKSSAKGFSLSRQTKAFFPNYIDDINIHAVNDNKRNVINKIWFDSQYIDFKKDENKPDDTYEPYENSGQLIPIFEFDNTINFRTSEESDQSFDYLVKSISYCIEANQNFNIPIITYYPVGYTKRDYTVKTIKPINQFSVYDEALSGEAFDFGDFVNWFTWLYNREIFKGTEDLILKAIKEAILVILNDEKDTFQQLFIDYEYYPGNLIIQKDNTKLKFNQLSSGEKSLITLVADLTRRLCIANPYTDNPLHGQGIVLIDEIDLHLHPRWQRKVVPKLREIFPNLQFVVTTHSPLVLTNSPEGKVFLLSDGKISELKHFIGQHIETALYQFYGIKSRPVEIQKKIDTLFELIDSDQWNEAGELLSELKSVLGEEDNAIIEAETSFNLITDDSN